MDTVCQQRLVIFADVRIHILVPIVNRVYRRVFNIIITVFFFLVITTTTTTTTTAIATRAPSCPSCACVITPCPLIVVVNPCVPNPW